MIRVNRVKGTANVIALQLLDEYGMFYQPNDDAICPRCGKFMRGPVSRHAKSRWVAGYVCSQCGLMEALEDAGLLDAVPLSEWAYVRDWRNGHSWLWF